MENLGLTALSEKRLLCPVGAVMNKQLKILLGFKVEQLSVFSEIRS